MFLIYFKTGNLQKIKYNNMSNILDNKRRNQIFGSFKNQKNIEELNKAYIEGVYADTPANRKLGRVGMSYSAYAEKIKGNDKKDDILSKLNREESDGETWYEGNIKGKKVRILQEEVGNNNYWNLEIDSSFIKNADGNTMSFSSPKEAMKELINGKYLEQKEKIDLSSLNEKQKKALEDARELKNFQKSELKQKGPSIPQNLVSVSDSNYKYALGKAPRGNGNWFYKIGDVAINLNGSYTDTKQDAIKIAALFGYNRVDVMS
jgi:hypothetical protein